MPHITPQRMIVRLERSSTHSLADGRFGEALARVAAAHPALEPLLDFVPPDPREIARQVGMLSAQDPDDELDLAEIDFGPEEWFEPAAGLEVVRRALGILRADPQSVRAALYDPGLQPTDVIRDLEQIEMRLEQAQQLETRFHFVWLPI